MGAQVADSAEASPSQMQLKQSYGMAQPTAGMQYSAFQKKSNSMQNHYGMKQETHFQQQQHNGTELPINQNGM